MFHQVYSNSYPAPKFGFGHQLSAYDIEEIKYYYYCGEDNKLNKFIDAKCKFLLSFKL